MTRKAMSLLSHLMGQPSIHIILIQGVSFLLSILLTVVLARLFGPEGKGLFDMLGVFLSTITEFFNLGVGTGVLMLLVSRKYTVGQLHGLMLFLSAICGLIPILIYLIFPNAVAALFVGLSVSTLVMGLMIGPALIYKYCWTNITLGLGHLRLQIAANGASNFLLILIFLPFYFIGPPRSGPEALVPAYYAAMTLPALGMFAWLFLKDRKLSLPSSEIKNVILFSSPVYLANIFNILHFRADMLMLNYYLGAADVGIYAVSVRLGELIFFLESALVSIHWKKIFGEGHFDHGLLSKALKQHLLAGLMITGLLALAAERLIGLLYGSDFSQASHALVILLPGLLIWSLSKIVSNYFTYWKKRPGIVLIIAGVGSSLNLILNYVFIEEFKMGINGAALASSISYSLVGAGVIAIYFLTRERQAQI